MDDLAHAVGVLLLQKRLTICTAESCTGGLIASRLTDIAGSSAYVLGGIVAYANPIKIALLGVNSTTLDAFGAVSEPVAREMALGARRAIGADLAVSVTGIAGPGGGSAEKPVGLTFIGIAHADGRVMVERHVWSGDRLAVKWASSTRALELIAEFA
jgi:nicotinamide-nucleotide amidase